MKWSLFLVGILFSTTLYSTQVPEIKFTMADIKCLAANMHYEARGESKTGQIAVAHVTLNRKKDKRFPNTICGVVKQPGQFSWVKDNPVMKAPKKFQQLALDVLSGKYKDPTRGALFFHNTSVESFKRRELVKIGNHIFYA